MRDKNVEKKIINDICCIFLPISFAFLLNLFYIGINYRFWFVLVTYKAIIIETIIVLSIFSVLLGIVKKGKKAVTILGLAILLLSIINQLKYSFTQEPVVFSDILFLQSTGELTNIIQGEIINTIKPILIPIIIEIILFISMIFYGRNLYKDIEINNKKIRIFIILVPIVVLSILYAPVNKINDIVKKRIFKTEDRKDYASFTSISEYYISYGVIGGMYGQLLENRIQMPENYNEETIRNALITAKENTNKILKKPNIIVIFSESFWDIDQLSEVKFNKKVTPNFNMLKEKGLFFDMISPSYGGVSANVEYEFLTGSNLMYFNRGYVPYMQLYNDDSYYNRPSIINELKNNGYRTKIATCAEPSLFNCGRFYKYLKVDETEYITNVKEEFIKGKYVSDEYVINKVINEFENKPKNEKLFYMTLTMQGHMPYSIQKYSNYDVWITESNLSENINNVLTSYAQGIYDADRQLGILYEYIQTIEEPTIIVFYGDHLPYLYSGKENALDILEYFNTNDKLLNNYRKYNIQSLIVANFEIQKDSENTKYLGPDLLSAYILNNINIQISDYYKFLYETRKTIGASNYLVTVDAEGNLYETSKLKGRYKELYDLRKNVEYKLFVKQGEKLK